MKILKKILAPKAVRITLNIIDEVGCELDGEAFPSIRNQIEEALLSNPDEVMSALSEGFTPRQQAYWAIANLSGHHLESGHNHIYRGILTSFGEDLLRLFDMSIDQLSRINAISDREAEAQKQEIRKNIKGVG